MRKAKMPDGSVALAVSPQHVSVQFCAMPHAPAAGLLVTTASRSGAGGGGSAYQPHVSAEPSDASATFVLSPDVI